MTIDAFVTQLEVRLGVDYTEEQRDFIKSLDSAGICFASPGTGKTASAVAGLHPYHCWQRSRPLRGVHPKSG